VFDRVIYQILCSVIILHIALISYKIYLTVGFPENVAGERTLSAYIYFLVLSESYVM
jgi:hypothetical protein